MSTIKSYKDLIAWQKGIELVSVTYQILEKFPKEEKFGLISQISRSSTSIPANIAEGWGRDSNANFCNFLKIAKGSLYELETHLIVSKNLNFISEKELELIQIKIDEIGRIIQGLIKSMKNTNN
ncbi:MAG: four helix bundle protein [Chitinophagales bacterium]